MRLAVSVIVLAVSLAGCVTSDLDHQDAGDAVDPAALLPWLGDGDDHDHQNWSQHDARWNVEPLGHTWLTDDPVNDWAHANMVVVRDGYAYVSLYEVPGSRLGGMMVVDLRDPAHPEVVATLETPHMDPIDVWVTDDGRYALLADHRAEVDGQEPPRVPGTAVPVVDKRVGAPYASSGVTVVDITDPTNPKQVHHYTLPPSGVHAVKSGVIAGDTYVFSASYGVHTVESVASHVDIARLVEDGDGVRLEHVSRYVVPETVDGDREVHDTWFAEHPVTGQPLLYVSAWDLGVHIVDLTDPTEPTLVGVWEDFDPVRYGNIHSAFPNHDLVEGRHVTVVTPEYASGDHGGVVWFVDTTDPAHPITITEFHLPLEPEVNPGRFLYSPHYGLIRDGVFHHAHNHAGYWAIEFGTPDTMLQPRVVAHNFPLPPDAADVAPDGPAGDRGAVSLWGVGLLEDGGVVVSDRYTGLHTFRIVDVEPGAPPWADLTT